MEESNFDPVVWEAWRRGRLKYKLRAHQQSKMYDFINQCPAMTIVLNCHRRFGKSYGLGVLAVERGFRYQKQTIKYGAPTFDQGQNIVRKAINKILEDCPPSMAPEYKYGKTWVFPSTKSELTVIGLNVEDGERLRGDALDLCVLDEVREVKKLDYIIKNIISYQFIGRTNPKLILATTPPKSLDHDFTQIYVPRAIQQNAYFKATVEDNKDWTAEDEELIVEELGILKDSPAWLREAMCRLDVCDEESLVVPEFVEEKNVAICQRPEWIQPVISVDLAYKDFSAALYGYVDFERQKLIIEDEVVVRNKNTKEIADIFSQKEKELWNNHKKKRKIDRFGDTTLQQRIDLEQLYRFYLREVEKYDVDEAIAAMRTSIGIGKIIINPKCKNLIFQLKNGLWNDRRTDFIRTDRAGHLDAVMALTYMNRTVDYRRDPNISALRSSSFDALQVDHYKEANDE